MQSASILDIISLVSFILAGVLLIVAGFLFFRLNIPQVIGYLSGKTAKKDIQRLQAQASNRADNSEADLPKIVTGKLHPENTKKKKPAKIKEKENNATTVLNSGDATTVLDSADKTTLLDGSDAQAQGTSQAEDVSPTEVLSPVEGDSNEQSLSLNEAFEIETDIVFLHTDEIIP